MQGILIEYLDTPHVAAIRAKIMSAREPNGKLWRTPLSPDASQRYADIIDGGAGKRGHAVV
eukprot:COSAG02_NODE_23937_length_703_cov_1.125828_1_plen_60_part_10